MRNLRKYFFTSGFWLLASGYLNAQLTITPTITNATCPADSNGSISISVSGGTAPYTYQWLPDGQTSPNITGLIPGTYSITVTDNSSASASASYVVGPPPISIDSSDVLAPVCTNNGHIVILAVSGGTGSSYQYAWSTGFSAQAITSLDAGNYSVIVTDANSCTKTFSYDLVRADCFVKPDPHFTPNDDNWNDTWTIANAQYFDNIHLIVFDRWGTRVHEQKGTYEPWEGKSYFGIPVPVAVYYYFFYQDKEDKQKEAISGSVTIMR